MRTIYPGVIYQFFGQFNSMGIFELELKKRCTQLESQSSYDFVVSGKGDCFQSGHLSGDCICNL